MTIEIRRPELEELIQAWMRDGSFDTVEDVLLQALRTAPLPGEGASRKLASTDQLTGTAIVEAFQASPFKEIDLEPTRFQMPVRDVVL
jgi:hypothetical protein